MLLLDINDMELALVDDGEVLLREPGVALLERQGPVFGYAALGQSRLRPRQAQNQFWQRMNADPATPVSRGVANQADLVYLQLKAMRAGLGIRGDAAVVVAAPSGVGNEQLAMLLGIAKEAGFDVRAILDASVAIACRAPLDGPCRVVDVFLQRSTVTRVDVDAGAEPRLRRGVVEDIPGCGFAALVEGWVDAVADRFVEATRFDPLRIAATEQQVFDQVVAGIEGDGAEFVIEVDHDDQRRQVSVLRRDLGDKSAQRYGLLAAALGAPGTLLLTHRARRMPGLAAHLAGAGHQIAAAEGSGPGAPRDAEIVASAALEHRALVLPQAGEQETGARLVASLPARTAAAARDAPAAATHLLCGALALALKGDMDPADHPGRHGAAAFRLRCNEGQVAVAPSGGAAVLLNGEPLDFERTAFAGDAIACDGDEFRLIALIDS